MGPFYPSSNETTPPPAPASASATDATSIAAEAQMAAINASAFPHIIDLIIEYSPHASLLTLRRLSRQLRALVDARLAYHLILPGPGDGTVSSPAGCAPAFYPLQTLLDKERVEDDEAWSTCLAHTRMVTLHTFETFASSSKGHWVPDAMNVLSSSLKHVKTVCINQCPGGSRIIPADARLAQLPAANVVVFATVTSPATMAHREAFRTLSGRKRGPDPYVYLPRSTRRLVLHITYDRIDMCKDGGFISVDNVHEFEHLEELVIIFKYEPEGGGVLNDSDADAAVPSLAEMPADYRRFSAWGGLHSIRRILNSYAAYHGERMGQTQFTVVDLPKVHPSVLGLADDTAREDFGRGLVRSIVYREWTSDWLYDPDKLCQQFEFIGADEYRSRVGEERWETETICSESPVLKKRAEARVGL